MVSSVYESKTFYLNMPGPNLPKTLLITLLRPGGVCLVAQKSHELLRVQPLTTWEGQLNPCYLTPAGSFPKTFLYDKNVVLRPKTGQTGSAVLSKIQLYTLALERKPQVGERGSYTKCKRVCYWRRKEMCKEFFLNISQRLERWSVIKSPCCSWRG